ncbi:MAG: D-alanyl-D-alanine carboxypeptidase [Chloroflexi bacterium]|nr:MAG: D-alanyl-D-alanine carboxypeptidase [Chloroflexota bacterium]
MRLRIGGALLLLVAGLVTFNYFRPIPAVAATASVPTSTTLPGTPPVLPWPKPGSGAIAISGLGMVATSGNEAPMPAASVAKVMTALLALEDKPLKLGDPGPSIVMTDADVQAYQADNNDKQSAVEVRSGEQLTEFQLLEGLLIPSANNFAFTLANWDAGSVDKFVVKMNKRAKELGLSHTKFADPAGANAQTVSTPSDLVALGMIAMNQEVLAQIVAKTSAKLPVAGTVFNVDYVLGQSGLIGIKTGSGFNQGANFLFAASITVAGFTKVVFGCVMGLATLADAFTAAKSLIAAVQPILIVKRILSKYQSVGSYEPPWGGHSELLSTTNVDLAEWPGMVLRQSLRAPALNVSKPLPSGTAAGVLHIVLGDYNLDVPLSTSDSLYPPGRFWRLTRI